MFQVMDFVIALLIVTLPIIAIGTATYLWIRGGQTPAQSLRRKHIVMSVGVGVVFLWRSWSAFEGSWLHRYLVGYATVGFANGSGVELRGVELDYRTGDNECWTDRMEHMRSASSYSRSNRRADLYLDRVICISNSTRLIFTNVAVAKRGEVLMVHLDSTRGLVTSHD